MNTPKFVISAIATAAIVGTLGLAYAQNDKPTNAQPNAGGNPPTSPKSANETPGPGTTPAPTRMDSSRSMGTGSTSSSAGTSAPAATTSDSTVSNERVAQVDRN